MIAAFLYDFMKIKDQISSDRVAEIAIGFVFAFISAFFVTQADCSDRRNILQTLKNVVDREACLRY